MSGFDFRDMLGGASATLGDTDARHTISAIGKAMLFPIVEQTKVHDCNPADVLASAITEVALLISRHGAPEEARRMLRHLAEVATGLEQTVAELHR